MYIYSSKTSADAVAKSTGCKESYCFMMLPNHNRIKQVFPDTMHTLKDCIEKIFFLLIGKVNLKQIIDSEASLGRFGLNIKRKRTLTDHKAVHLPYILSSEEIKLAERRAKEIVLPNSDFEPGTIFNTTSSLKSHNWKEVLGLNILISIYSHSHNCVDSYTRDIYVDSYS